MGKEGRDRNTARDKAAQMRAAERRREQRRRMLIAGGAFVAVLLVIGGIVGLKAAGVGSSKKKTSGTATQGANASILKDLVVPPATLDAVGVGTANNPPSKINAPPLTSGGKPEVLYVGAEYCPYCAAERWAVAVALSRFGTLNGVGLTTSSAIDVDPSTPTLSFHKATLTSSTISFVGYEETTNKSTADGSGYEPLDTLSTADAKLVQTYDYPPYVSSKGAIPFIDIGGTYVQSGAAYDPGLLAGKTHAQIAAALSDPTNPIAKAVNGSANALTAAICATTNQQPSNVCGAAGVKAAAAKLGKGS